MRIVRGLFAIILGVVCAAMLNTLLLIVALNEAPSFRAEDLKTIPVIAAVGAVITAPAWLLFCLLLLPVATYRVSIAKPLSPATFLAIAALLGAALIMVVPVMLVEAESQVAAMATFAPLGASGGVSIALFWKRLVLDRLGASAAGATGESNA